MRVKFARSEKSAHVVRYRFWAKRSFYAHFAPILQEAPVLSHILCVCSPGIIWCIGIRNSGSESRGSVYEWRSDRRYITKLDDTLSNSSKGSNSALFFTTWGVIDSCDPKSTFGYKMGNACQSNNEKKMVIEYRSATLTFLSFHQRFVKLPNEHSSNHHRFSARGETRSYSNE